MGKTRWKSKSIRRVSAAAGIFLLAALAFALGQASEGGYLPAGGAESSGAIMSAVAALGLCADPPCDRQAAEAAAGIPPVCEGCSAAAEQTDTATGPTDTATGRADANSAPTTLHSQLRPVESELAARIETLNTELEHWRSLWLAQQRNTAASREQAALLHKTLADEVRDLRQEVADFATRPAQTERPAESDKAPAPAAAPPAIQWHFDSVRALDGRHYALIRRHASQWRQLSDAGRGGAAVRAQEQMYLLQVGERLQQWRIRRLDVRAGLMVLEDTQSGQLHRISAGDRWQ